MKAILKLVFISVFSSTTAFAGNILKPEMTCDQLKDLIINKKISTVDNLLIEMPKSFLRNSVLVYDSRALNTNLVNFATPRTILFNEDSSMILSYTRFPGEEAVKKGKDSLEGICFNKDKFVYEMMEIEMNGTAIPFVDFQPTKNPATCLSCHGSNPRPILQDYNAWPGIYGSFSQKGVSAHGSIEKEKLLSFVQLAPTMKRYKYLDLSKIVPDPSQKSEVDLTKRDLVSFYDGSFFSPVVILGQNIQRNMEYRLAKKLIDKLNDTRYKSLRSLLAYIGSDLNTCGNIRERIKTVYEKMIEVNDTASIANELTKNTISLIENDFAKHKLDRFNTFNIASVSADARGVISIPKNNTVEVYDPNYPSKDQKAYVNQLVLLQGIAEYYDLSSEDISSFPEAPTLGLGHILRQGLYKDEQFFLGITEAMLTIDPFAIPRLENNCEERKKYALEQVLNLKFGTKPSVFMPVAMP